MFVMLLIVFCCNSVQGYYLLSKATAITTAFQDYRMKEHFAKPRRVAQRKGDPAIENLSPLSDQLHGDGSGEIDNIDRGELLEKYRRRDKRRNEMPLSQKWYKDKQRHLSKNQKRILSSLWPTYGMDLKFNSTIQLVNYNSSSCNSEIDSNAHDSSNDKNQYVVLDIGFGRGESIHFMARQGDAYSVSGKKHLFLGCELHKAGLSSALQSLNASGLTNTRLIRSDVTVLLEEHMADDCLDEVCVYFPDPWPNANRDSDRRVIRPYMLQLLEKKLKTGGLLRIATDVEDYAGHIRETILRHNSDRAVDAIGTYKLDTKNTATEQTESELGIELEPIIISESKETSSAARRHFSLLAEICHPACLGGPPYRPVTSYEKKAAGREDGEEDGEEDALYGELNEDVDHLVAVSVTETSDGKYRHVPSHKRGHMVWDFEYMLR